MSFFFFKIKIIINNRTMVLMETLAFTYIGNELLTDSTKSIYEKISSIISYTTPEVSYIYYELDIKTTVEIIGQFIKDLESHKIISKSPIKNSIILSIKKIYETLSNIDSLMNKIDNDVINHNNKWFSTWRTPKYLSELDNLKILKNHLNNRFDALDKVIRISNNID